MRHHHITTALLISYLLTTGSAQALPVNNEVNSVVTHLVGIMDTSAQAAENPKKSSVRMTTCQVTFRGANDSVQNSFGSPVYLYQEQALTQELNKPYRQRFLEIQPSVGQETVESKSYKPAQPETLIGLCNKPESERVLQQSDLGEFVCRVFLKPSPDGFIGETPPEGCPANVRGAVKITNTIILHSRGMDTWDKGYDAQGHQVWGAREDAYQYRWVNQQR
ncbi:chromophore lyase CpcT/CpeT [Gloeothece verrucosa]|uniref:Chromophore lyase CpcT/CpeT n=1 Tax=Gloeothece verrucosa (strain PCC 7822) TaxID=497965 RepID=E0U6E1_GLOV7|nr:chromophore lyase CpcT/CpeT [Gloeothece verrucosa]ADN13584.1 protein of unknown function DUF1001 [Gloeothece verrucosa PCC 7822]